MRYTVTHVLTLIRLNFISKDYQMFIVYTRTGSLCSGRGCMLLVDFSKWAEQINQTTKHNGRLGMYGGTQWPTFPQFSPQHNSLKLLCCDITTQQL